MVRWLGVELFQMVYSVYPTSGTSAHRIRKPSISEHSSEIPGQLLDIVGNIMSPLDTRNDIIARPVSGLHDFEEPVNYPQPGRAIRLMN